MNVSELFFNLFDASKKVAEAEGFFTISGKELEGIKEFIKLLAEFKGKDIIQKNIYEVLETGVKYTGTAEGITDKLIIYKNIFQEDKIFAREESQLAEQLEESKQKEFGQKYRVEKLTQEEIEMIKTEEFIKAKKEYMKEVR
jgi:hypothetical protein